MNLLNNLHARSPRIRLLLEFVLYAFLTTFALHSTWLTWPDAVIDFSRELYLPWRVSCGDVLYRDLAYYYGPVSVYTNAILFALLGRPSIHALFALNFAFWIATLLALRALLRRIASPLATIVAVSSFILLFSFNRYTDIGNDNFLAPYSHEITRGFLFALLELLALDSALRRRAAPLALLSGFLLGLSLFSKPEISLAAIASSAILLLFWRCGQPARDGSSPRAPFLGPELFFFALGILASLALVVAPFAVAFHSVFQALNQTLLKLYLDCFNPTLTSLPYFKEVQGTDAILSHVLRLFLGTALAATPFLLARCILPRFLSPSHRLAAAILLALASAAMGWFAFFPLNAALPIAPVLFALLPIRAASPCKPNASHFHPPLLPAFATFAFVLVYKIVLNANIGHYGFVLALPAFCCAVLFAFRSPCAPGRALLAGSLIIGFSASALQIQSSVFRRWDLSHAIHDGSYLASPLDSRAFGAALDWIRTHTPPTSSLAVLPEGSILNVLSVRPNPTPYVSLPITDWLRYDETTLLAAYSNSPPDTLVLVQTTQNRFGIDYANSLFSLLDPLYTPALTITIPSPSGPCPYLLVATRSPLP